MSALRSTFWAGVTVIALVVIVIFLFFGTCWRQP
jgi:hypothetical protein